VVVAARVEHVVREGQGNDAVVVPSQFFSLHHLRPAVHADLAVVATCVEMHG
jgi:hypothetical protein